MKFMEMKMVLCSEVKHFNGARDRAHTARFARTSAPPTYDDNDFALQHKDFRSHSC